jgi:hypothetical protein
VLFNETVERTNAPVVACSRLSPDVACPAKFESIADFCQHSLSRLRTAGIEGLMKAIAAAAVYFTLLLLTGCGEQSQPGLAAQPAVEEGGLLRATGNPDSEAVVWFIKAGATGHGRDRSSPFGSTAQVEDASRPGDIILLLSADEPLDDGLTLKPRQTLIGVAPELGQYPLLSNTTGDRNSGHGLILADGVRVEGIEVRNTHASGIYGVNASNVEISDVLISNANTGQLTMPERPTYLDYTLTHAGIVLLGSSEGGTASLELTRTRVLGSAGLGVVAAAYEGAHVSLDLLDSEVRDGPAIDRADRGIYAFAHGDSSTVHFEVVRSTVSGRMSRWGRNISLQASRNATVSGLVYESSVGASGQDGINAGLLELPAVVDLSIVGSTIENSAQSNIEGTMNTFMPHDAAAASASWVDITIDRSTIRGAGRTPYVRADHFNILMTGSPTLPNQPLPRGRYRLSVIDSEISASQEAGLWVGAPWGGEPIDPGQFEILVRGTRFLENKMADVQIGASAVEIDARQNCWLSPDGREEARVITTSPADDGTVDTSDSVPCGR